ncbi:MAG: hypothetical protein ACFFCF_12455, partial [Promethearchaeota archaeon]
MFYAVMMLFFFALAYLTVGLRALLVIPNATPVMLQGWSVQWGLYLAVAGFFMVLWAIRTFNKEYFAGRSAWGALIPISGLGGFAALIFLSALTHSESVVHGFVTWLAPNLTTYYGLGFTIFAIVYAIFYLGLVPLITLWLYMRTRRGLGQKVFIKDLLILVGLLIILVTILIDFGLLFITPVIIPVIAVRVVTAVGFILVWFGYRLANFI